MQISKYSASGNDFAIFVSLVSKNRSELARKICDRFNGIGADGLIVILPDEKYDFKWEFYNSDGSLASMCGNGSRAACMFAYENNLAKKDMSFLSNAGLINGKIYDIKDKISIVEIELTKPKELAHKFEENGYTWYFYDTGVPHLVSFVSDIESVDFKLAKAMREKYNANVNFAQIKDDNIFVRTFERGVEAETMACGTGMAACFYAGFKHKSLSNKMKVYPTSKEELEFRVVEDRIYFKGKVIHSFDAIFYG
ncbi:diaminopimelate epimerase [Campylobacter blaseri]|uniref:Diaminopimelate epimerase n=1 Tax=Campylobacter blaseri TaxID=2042961 RepID=A0A2P8R3B1_9BACT|nr:diaminopimelate epimerase [Campylobacter blaseri]PSM52987.1 diaminopimelate epimerase [Campylobacter blaseri]PSM54454.1 diaminopimelate epimerase [Campylobacter blaseri]QKF85302.1 diaminopimelate epimerase [Campylobacter blaseri]